MKMLISAAAPLIALAALTLSGPASAQEQAPDQQMGVAQARYYCLPHEQAADKLSTKFEEKVVGIGLGQDQKSVVELYVSEEGSWTILVTLNNGMSCITAAGKDWTEMAPTAALVD